MTEAWHLLPKCHTSECPLSMTPPRHGQAGRQWPLQRLGMMTARLALLKSVCAVLLNEAVRGALSGQNRIPGCMSVSGGPWSSSGAAEVQPGAGAALGTGLPCWPLLPTASSPAESFTRTQTIPGGSSRASCPSNSGPCGQRGSGLSRGLQSDLPAAPTSREALIAKLEGSCSGN